jgi:hypothetical protein
MLIVLLWMVAYAIVVIHIVGITTRLIIVTATASIVTARCSQQSPCPSFAGTRLKLVNKNPPSRRVIVS